MSAVVVYGASGHTGSFVVRELARRGLRVIRAGRSPADDTRVASVSDAAALDRALAGADAVINCAGPFLDTARPIIEAAIRAGIPYLDVTAEQASARATLADFADAPVPIIPACGFYGGLADLLATALVGTTNPVDALEIQIALDHWWPTPGTRTTGARNTAPRVVVTDGVLAPVVPTPTHVSFPPPFGEQDMIDVPFSEIITLHHHLRAHTIRTRLNQAPLAELRDARTPPPHPVDASGRSAQQFLMQVVATTPAGTLTAHASGRDIYAITAPLVVEATTRILTGHPHRGTGVLGSLFDATAFLAALRPALSYAA